jgi:hypothetical protein
MSLEPDVAGPCSNPDAAADTFACMAPPYKVLGWAIFTVICYIVFIGLAIAMRPYSGDHFGLERDLAYNWCGRGRCSALVVCFCLFPKKRGGTARCCPLCPCLVRRGKRRTSPGKECATCRAKCDH